MQNFKLYTMSNFVKIDRNITCSKVLSPGAKTLYMFLMSLPQGKHATNAYVSKSLDVSERTVGNWRKELVDAGLLHIKRISKTQYQSFLGDTSVSGLGVMRRLQEDELHPKKEQSE